MNLVEKTYSVAFSFIKRPLTNVSDKGCFRKVSLSYKGNLATSTTPHFRNYESMCRLWSAFGCRGVIVEQSASAHDYSHVDDQHPMSEVGGGRIGVRRSQER